MLLTERIAQLRYGRSLPRRGIAAPLMSARGHLCPSKGVLHPREALVELGREYIGGLLLGRGGACPFQSLERTSVTPLAKPAQCHDRMRTACQSPLFSDSDQIPRRSEMTRWAKSGHRDNQYPVRGHITLEELLQREDIALVSGL